MVNVIENPMTASWVAATSGSQTRGLLVQESLVFFGLLAAGLIAGLLCVAWLRAPLRRTEDTPAERRGRFERRRAQLCLGFGLVLYYAAALPVVIIYSGWAAVDPYLRGHLFDGFGCAALLTVAWSQLTRPMPMRLRPAGVRMSAAQFLLPLASAAIAAAAAYVANGSWEAVLTVLFVAYIFSYKFWEAVVNTAGYDEINKENSGQQDAQSLRNSRCVSEPPPCQSAPGHIDHPTMCPNQDGPSMNSRRRN
jgi:MFS family permease